MDYLSSYYYSVRFKVYLCYLVCFLIWLITRDKGLCSHHVSSFLSLVHRFFSVELKNNVTIEMIHQQKFSYKFCISGNHRWMASKSESLKISENSNCYMPFSWICADFEKSFRVGPGFSKNLGPLIASF